MIADFAHEPPEPRPTTPRTRAIAAEFKLEFSDDAPRRRRPRCQVALPRAGEVMLLAGASGSGKSSLLRALVRRARREGAIVVDLRRIVLPRDRPTLDCFDDADVGDALRRLARVGLAEVWTWLRPPSQLSEGQRWRLRLALALVALERAGDRRALLVCDEFAALLDRITAHVVASLVRRTASANGFAAIVATSHDDLVGALRPDAIVACDFGSVRVTTTREAR